MSSLFLRVLCTTAVAAASALSAAEIPFRSGDKVAFLGDSITFYGANNPLGYVKLVTDGLKQAGIAITPVPAGVSGNQCVHMAKRLEKDVLKKQVQWMFLSCGVNDAPNGMDNPGIPLETYQKTIGAILDRCAAAKINVIILTATPVVEEPEHVANKNLVAYNDALRAIAKKRSLPLIDLDRRFQAVIAKKPDPAKRTLTVDGTHMSPLGDILIAYTILQTLGMPPEMLHRCAGEWMDRPDGWALNPKLHLSVNEMEALEKILPPGTRMETFLENLIREKIRQKKPAAPRN